MKLLFIPNWNGHLFLQEYKDNSITKLFAEVKFKNKELVAIVKNNINKTNKIIEKEFEKSFKKYGFILSITGDHSNSYSLIKSFSKQRKSSENFKLVIFDAHPDVEIGTDLVSHEDYLRYLIDENIVVPTNVYLFGIRTFSRTEFEYLQEKGVNFFSISDVLREKEKIKQVLSKINDDIYLSVDIDVLDPDVAPGTYYREWCGLYLEELQEFVNIIKNQISSADITEFYSQKDEEDITKKNVLKLIDSFVK